MFLKKLTTCIFCLTIISRAYSGDVLFQASTIDALMEGVFDGTMPVGKLKRHGDFGLGTVNALDGEMIALDGKYYQGLANGKVIALADNVKTPFATVTFFRKDQCWKVSNILSIAQLQGAIDKKLMSPNLFYAIRIDGNFTKIKLRSVPKQKPPYRTLPEVVKTQSEYELTNVEGTLIGFRCPPYVKGVNVPGYHFHFLSRDRTKGGHVLDLSLAKGTVAVDELADFQMVLPLNRAFLKTDLSTHKEAALRVVEQGR